MEAWISTLIWRYQRTRLQEDAEQVNRQFQPVMLYEQQLLAGSTKDEGSNVTLSNAGHVLGSACVLVEAMEKGPRS